MGGRKDVLLGAYGTPESQAEYMRIVSEWQAAGRRLSEAKQKTQDLTTNEMLLAYWRHAETYYRTKDGEPSRELEDIRLSLRPLKALYGDTLASHFSPLSLETIRQQFIRQPIITRTKELDPKTGEKVWKEKIYKIGLARGVINQRIGRIVRVFKWATSKELIPVGIYQALSTLEGLKAGRSEARETKRIRPVSEALILDTLPHLSSTVAHMVSVLLYTGMRAGELCVMRSCDLDMSGTIWIYAPMRHKTEHHGHIREIAIGPKAQEIIKGYLKADAQAILFSPKEAMEKFRLEQRQKRKSRVQPSQVCRKKDGPKRQPRDQYDARTISKAIAVACRKHDLPRWHVHQIRHLAATMARREFGLDHARAALGHRSPGVTTLYAELSKEKAIQVASKLG
jgi:integrase